MTTGVQTLIEFEVAGVPVGEPRHRTALRRGRIHHVRDERADSWKQTVRQAARQALLDAGLLMPLVPLGVPVRVELEFRMPRPKAHFGTGRNAERLKSSAPSWHTATPDGDNLEKALIDACGPWPRGSRAILWADDSVVAVVIRSKRYTSDAPGASVRVSLLEGAQ